MRLYLTAKTNIPDVFIDFIEVQLKNGERVSLNWDESDISRTETGFDARYKGVYFGEEYGNGRIADLEGLEISDIGLYFEAKGAFEFAIEEMEFEDYDKTLAFKHPIIPERCSGMTALKAVCPQLINEMNDKVSLSDQIQAAASLGAGARSADKAPIKGAIPQR